MAHKKNLYHKSRYYKERQKQLQKGLFIAGGVLVLLAGGLLIRGCVSHKATTVSVQAEQEKETKAESLKTEDNTEENSGTVHKEPVSLTVSVVGDCTLGTDEYFDYDTSLNAYYENYGADYFLQNVKSIFSSDDLTIANFEGTLTESTEREDKEFAFKAPAEFAGILTGSSVEAVNTANNHSHDYGDQGYEDTLKALGDADLVYFGYDDTAVMDVKGVKVGLVGIYELKDHLEREEQLKTNIEKVKEEGAEITIVIFHWGNEKDLVCGHHPHVLQGIEEYKGKNIVYSLGNFCFGGNQYPSDMDSMIFQQTFTLDQNGLKADNVTNIIPCSISSDSDYNNYQPTPAEGEEADRILQKIQERSSWISEGISSSDDQSSKDEIYDEDTPYYDDSEEDYSDSEDGYEEDFTDSQETDDSEEEW